MPEGDHLITVEGLSKSYGAPVFQNVAFSLRRGEALGVTGGNGSGKTTLLNIVAGLEQPDAGTINKTCRIGYVTQKAGLFARLSCLDNMRYVCALNGLSKQTAARRIEECAALCGVTDFLRKKAGLCSGGMAQRLNVAMALLPGPDLLLLDEAAAGLDSRSRDSLRALLGDFVKGNGVIMVSHYREELAGICARALEMETGRIAYD